MSKIRLTILFVLLHCSCLLFGQAFSLPWTRCVRSTTTSARMPIVQVIPYVWEKAKASNGKVYDPYTGEEIIWNGKRPRTWDMGHKREHKYKDIHECYMNDEISKEVFLMEYHSPNNYQPQTQYSNRGHLGYCLTLMS